MDAFDPDGADEERYLVCSNLIACHTLWYDNTNVDAGLSLGRVIVHLRPEGSNGFPIRQPRLFLYAELHGTSDEYIVRARLIRVEVTSDDEEVETEHRWYGPWEITVSGDNYVECFGFPIPNVIVPEEGVYEFQLWADGFDVPIGRRRFQARL